MKKASHKLPIWDQRMILLMKHCIDSDFCDSQKDFLISIGALPTTIRAVRTGSRSFTVSQIAAACKKYKTNPAWILGLSPDMALTKGKSAIQNLKDAVRAVEAEQV